MKQLIKRGIKLVLDSNGSPTAMVVILCKAPITILLNELIPDEAEKK